MAIRVAATLRHQGERAAGSMRNSEGRRRRGRMGQARRVGPLHTGPVDGKPVGIAIFDHPENSSATRPGGTPAPMACSRRTPSESTTSRRRRRAPGDWTITAGEELRLRYQLLFHDGEIASEQLDEELRRYAGRLAGRPRVPRRASYYGNAGSPGSARARRPDSGSD